jgi:hypothetical protein
MFIADGMTYLELQKTGGSHICHLLALYANGQAVGKHNRVINDLNGRYIIGSIRNPWDWYVSLWAYGVGGRGAIRKRTETNFDLDYYFRQLPKSMGKNWLTLGEFFVSAKNDMHKPIERWQLGYQSSADPEAFRKWLKLILNRERRFDIGEGYGFSPLSQHAGLLSYRYFRLFTTGDSVYRDARLCTDSGIADFDGELNITDGVVKTEALEDDFIRVLSEAGKELTASECVSIKSNGKTNVSERQPFMYYYDNETLDLVASREKYLINKYDYDVLGTA